MQNVQTLIFSIITAAIADTDYYYYWYSAV